MGTWAPTEKLELISRRNNARSERFADFTHRGTMKLRPMQVT